MLNDLLDFSRLQSCKLKIYRKLSDINDIISETYEQMKPRALKQGIGFSKQIPPKAVKMDIDPRRIKQILINLIDNALKFTPEGGKICITGQEKNIGENKFYVIDVSDTGRGISREEIR